MELTKEFIEEHKLDEAQVTAITGYVDTEIVPSLKKEYDGKANENAEGILTGAGKYAKEKLGVDLDREQGEKIGDYLSRVLDAKFSNQEADIVKRQGEIDKKLKDFKGGDELKQALLDEKEKNDKLLQQVAELEPLKGIDEKYNTQSETLSKLKREVAYGGVKPNFPESVNKFEADAKWNAFKNGIEEKYNLELVDGKAVAIDKENEHKRFDLETLVAQDKDISELLKGRQQRGTGAAPVDFREVEGIPFKIPVNATSEDITKLVREHTLKEVGDLMHPDYSKKFQELFLKVKKASV